ncbi:MAG: hypothetical protein PQJ50_13125 [Spirochaetales bacterium]|nr:hypothetical protein [Spirochaetales bacterium]
MVGESNRRYKVIYNADEILSILENSSMEYEKTILRTQLNGGTLHYNGTALDMKYVFGVDWQEERDIFESMSYTSRTDDPYTPGSIMISSPVAEQLQARVGDLLTLEVRTLEGQVNTMSLVVSALVEDRSLFGYFKCYISRDDLNNLAQFPADAVSNIGLYLNSNQESGAVREELYGLLSSEMDVAPLFEDRKGLYRARWDKWQGTRLFLVPLSVYLSEVDLLLKAISMVSYCLYALMVLIITVSVAVTFRLVLHEREREIGTMRAIAFHQSEIVVQLMFETLILFIFSLGFGLVLSRFVVTLASFVDYSFIPSFEIFLENGKLTAVYTVSSFLANAGIVFLAVLPAVLFPVIMAAKRPLAGLLSGGSK